jgi:HK97 gp10 family phage protein
MAAFDLTVNVDLAEISAALDGITASADKHVREAAQAGAEHLYFEARLRVPESEKEHWFHGTNKRYLFQPGTLRNSLYQVYSKDHSGKSVATYHVAWNHKKCPYGFMVEYGTVRAPAHPFLRPAYDAAAPMAREIVAGVLISRIREDIRGST